MGSDIKRDSESTMEGCSLYTVIEAGSRPCFPGMRKQGPDKTVMEGGSKSRDLR